MNIPDPPYTIQRYKRHKARKLYIQIEYGTCEYLRNDLAIAFKRFGMTIAALTRYFFDEEGVLWADWNMKVERRLYKKRGYTKLHRRVRALGREVDTALQILKLVHLDYIFELGEVWMRVETMITAMERIVERVIKEHGDNLRYMTQEEWDASI